MPSPKPPDRSSFVPRKMLTPTTVAGTQTNTVSQKFERDAGEGLFGLGQHPTGEMNYVGTTVHLQQKNMDVAVPVLLIALLTVGVNLLTDAYGRWIMQGAPRLAPDPASVLGEPL